MLRAAAAEPPAPALDCFAGLRALQTLARQPSPGRRARLLLGLADMLLAPASRLGRGERTLMEETLLCLLPAVDTPSRRALAERLAAARTEIPERLIRTLAGEPIAIAEPLLLAPGLLAGDTLADLARTHGSDHRQAMARQRFLPFEASAALTESEDETALALLLRNDQARISPQSFARLADRYAGHDALRLALLMRHDLPARIMGRLFLAANRAERRFILAETFKRIAARGSADREEDWRLAARAPGLGAGAEIAAGLRHHQGTELASILARAARLESGLAEAMLSDASCEPIAVLCRALGIDRAVFSSFVVLGAGKRAEGLPLDRMLALYEDIRQDVAREILRSWQEGTLDPRVPLAEDRADKGRRALGA